MHSNNQEYIHNHIQEKYIQQYEPENKNIKKLKNYNTHRMKRGSYENIRPLEEDFNDHSYDSSKQNVGKTYIIRKKNSNQEENFNYKSGQNINFKNKYVKIQPDYKITNNDIMRINTFTYFSEEMDKNNERSASSNKNNKKLENSLYTNNPNRTRVEDNNNKNMNRIEIDNNSKNNGNLVFYNSNKNTSVKITNKTKKKYNNSNTTDEKKEKILNNNRRKYKNEVLYTESNINHDYINDNRLNENENEKKYSKHSNKISNNNRIIQMSGFEISYESDKGERNSYNSYRKNRNNFIGNINYNHNYNNIYYTNINLDEQKKNNYKNDNDDNELYDYTNDNLYQYNNANNQKNFRYKYQIVHNNSSTNNKINNTGKKRNNINDSVEMNDLHSNNNKSVSVVSSNKKKNIKTSNNSRPLKSSSSNIINNDNNKVYNSNFSSNKNSIDFMNQKKIITRKEINTNVSMDNPKIIPSQNINKKNSNGSSLSSNTNNSSTRIKKKTGNNGPKPIKFKSYHRQSEIKKIILIQSTYRAHLVKLRISDYLKVYYYFKDFFDLLFNIFLIRKANYWKLFLKKIPKWSSNRLIKKAKNVKNVIKENKNTNSYMNTNNRLILKTNEINMLHKELGDSFNIINDNNGLKLKLDDMIKENNELKNQIYDNKNIEERLKQLLVENKKNQNINAIIMKDNQQLAKRLKNIQDNRNNKLVIQNQKSFDLAMEDNLQFQSASKLKYLYIKCLVFKKILKNRNIMKSYFNKYRHNTKKIKNFKIENNNIFINNKKKVNIQMAKSFNINYISQKETTKHFHLYKLIQKKEEEKIKLYSKYFYKLFYINKYMKIYDQEEKKQKEKEIEIIKDKNEQKRNILQSIIDKYERNYEIKIKNKYKEWRLRSVIFKMKGVAKEIKRKKKLKKKIRDKLAKETLNNMKNKTATFQSAHEFSYKIDKVDKNESKDKIKKNKLLKSEDILSKEGNVIKEEDEKNENNDDQEDSEESFGLDE